MKNKITNRIGLSPEKIKSLTWLPVKISPEAGKFGFTVFIKMPKNFGNVTFSGLFKLEEFRDVFKKYEDKATRLLIRIWLLEEENNDNFFKKPC